MKFLAGLEANRLAGSDGDFRPGPRVAANPRLARAHVEDTKAPQFNAVARSERLFQAFKYGVDRGFRFVAG